MVAGLVLGVVRFALCAFDSRAGVLAGVVLHGASYTWIFITAQIYLNERVDPSWRARAQALMSLTVSGAGNLAGYLGVGWWFADSAKTGGAAWPTFWTGLSVASVVVLGYFLIAYHGRGKSPRVLTQSVDHR
jgi:MFS family permease